jgi:hypothetical protein
LVTELYHATAVTDAPPLNIDGILLAVQVEFMVLKARLIQPVDPGIVTTLDTCPGGIEPNDKLIVLAPPTLIQ